MRQPQEHERPRGGDVIMDLDVTLEELYSGNFIEVCLFCTLLLNPYPNEKFYTLPNWKSLQMTISNVMKIAESSPNDYKTLWEKEKLLVSSNFSFSHNVFKRLILQTRKNQGLFGKGLNLTRYQNCSLVHRGNIWKWQMKCYSYH